MITECRILRGEVSQRRADVQCTFMKQMISFDVEYSIRYPKKRSLAPWKSPQKFCLVVLSKYKALVNGGSYLGRTEPNSGIKACRFPVISHAGNDRKLPVMSVTGTDLTGNDCQGNRNALLLRKCVWMCDCNWVKRGKGEFIKATVISSY